MLIGNRCDWSPREKRWKTVTHSTIWMFATVANCMWKTWGHKSVGRPYFWLNTLARWWYICWSISDLGYSTVIDRQRLITPQHSKRTASLRQIQSHFMPKFKCNNSKFSFVTALRPLVGPSIMRSDCSKLCSCIASRIPRCRYWICSRIALTIGDSRRTWPITLAIRYSRHHQICKFTSVWLALP